MKIVLSEKKEKRMKEDKNRFQIFSVREIKSNPFAYEDDNVKIKTDEVLSNVDYKTEIAMEYEIIYNSYFLDQ